MSTDKEKLLDHDYDGIKELDNPLPNWWLITFYGTVFFGIGYFVYFQFLGGASLRAAYQVEFEKHGQLQASYLERISAFDNELFLTYYKNSQLISYGKDLFEQNCLSCHKPNAIGDIGPNLVDAFWLYSDGSPETIFQFVLQGNPEGGMPAWIDKLTQDELYSIISYIMSEQGKHNGKGKTPQGEEFPFWNIGNEEGQ